NSLSRGALEECESQILARVRYPYPTSREIYSAWVEELETVPPDPEDAVTPIRLEAARARMNDPIVSSKSYATLVEFKLPLLIQGGTSTHHLWQGVRAIDHDLQSAYLVGVMQWNR